MAPHASLAAAVLGSLAPLAMGHAYLAEPPSRNVLAYAWGQETCPHCLQSGGPDAVKARGLGAWPTKDAFGSHGLCGNPVQKMPEPVTLSDESYLVPTPVQRTYHAGETVEFVVGVSTHHLGHYEFRICDRALDHETLASVEEGQACLNEHVLQRAPLDASCVPDDPRGDCQPIDEAHPGRWYLPPPHGDTQVAGASWNDAQANRLPALTETHVMRFLIPQDLQCTHCTLQWYWSTGNSCLYDADYFSYFKNMQALGWSASAWSTIALKPWATCANSCCGSAGSGLHAEEFWNCADIAVLPATGSAAQGPAPILPASPAPTQAPAAAGTPAVDRTSTAAPASTPMASIAPAAAPVAAPTPSPAALEAGAGGACADAWDKCGGNGWAGPTCCADGYVCEAESEWYYQCRPGMVPAPAAPTPALSPSPDLLSPSQPSTTTPAAAPSTTMPTTATAAPAAAPVAAPTPSPAALEAGAGGACADAWDKCGGNGWAGPTCCADGYVCEAESEWYSQCRPGEGSAPAVAASPALGATATPIRAPAAAPAAVPTPSQATLGARAGGFCSGAWGKCGGNNWAGPTCCVEGYMCIADGEWYSQCLPNPLLLETSRASRAMRHPIRQHRHLRHLRA